MPTTNQGDYGMLHVTLMSKDGRKLLIDENFSVDMDLMEDGTYSKLSIIRPRHARLLEFEK